MKSTLQNMDSNLNAKDGFIHELNGRLMEKDKVVQSNKAEIERLEKKNKLLEHKVRNKHLNLGACLFRIISHMSDMFLFQFDIMQKASKNYEVDKRSMQQELETREQRLQRELAEKRRMEQRLHGVVSDTQHKWEKECVSWSSYTTDPALCCLQAFFFVV